MKPIFCCAFLFLPLLSSGQTGSCAQVFETAMQADRRLSIDVRSGAIEIAGSSRATLRVTCTVRDGAAAEGVKAGLAASHLRIYGGPSNNVKIRIEIPDRTNLVVRATAGDLTISGVTGDKDVELRAGDLTIHVGAPEQYRVAEGSVLAGDLNAEAFGVVKDGLFRSFRKDHPEGRYRLRAKLLAGDLVLK